MFSVTTGLNYFKQIEAHIKFKVFSISKNELKSIASSRCPMVVTVFKNICVIMDS